MERILQRVGWPLQRLGPARSIGSTVAVAGYLRVSREALAHLGRAGSLSAPVIAPAAEERRLVAWVNAELGFSDGRIVMEVRDLMYIEASAAAANFTRAAKFLGINTATISRRVSQLEDELGLALFERGSAGVRLTSGGRALLPHVRRALAELDAIKRAATQRGKGLSGEVRLAVRMAPIGEALRSLLGDWRKRHRNVRLTVFEMNEPDIQTAMRERRVDVALMMSQTLWPDAVAAPLYRERLLAALPCGHPLSGGTVIDWRALRHETFLVQGWDNSQSAREFYASFLGSGLRLLNHPASKQTVLALVAAGFGITLVTKSQAEISVPRVVYCPICEDNAWVEVELLWFPDAEDPAVGRFVAFMRDEARSRGLF
jgi:DNA-binding transcriptional LysR family regulator